MRNGCYRGRQFRLFCSLPRFFPFPVPLSFPGCSAPWSKVNHPRPGVRHGRENGKRKPYISPHGYPPWPTRVNHRPSIRIVHTIHCCVIPSRRAWFLFLFPSQTWNWRSSVPSPPKTLSAERHVAGKQCRYSNNNRTCDAAYGFGHRMVEKRGLVGEVASVGTRRDGCDDLDEAHLSWSASRNAPTTPPTRASDA